MGLTITISPHRKHGNGAKGGGRKGSTGKKAVVYNKQGEKFILTASTATELLHEVRDRFNIPSHTTINKEGETRI